MQSPQSQPKDPVQQSGSKPTNRPNEQGHILVQDHFVIRDRSSEEVLVKGRG